MTNFSTSKFTYDKSSNVFYANMDALGLKCYPDTFTLVSAKTGKEIKFVKNIEAAEKNEWWDGVMYEYKMLDGHSKNIRVIVTESGYLL
jgi:formate-dependent phosphoribosylglycinamide formyltransferase (GAR transformylase)